MNTNLSRLSLAVRVLVALILVQTLFFKFSGAPESVFIFESLGLEPLGRIGSGIVELAAAVLLLLRPTRFVALGALLALGTMVGAIGAHLTTLGIVVQDDGGLLFAMALLVFAASAFTLAVHRAGLVEWRARLAPERRLAR
jgi:phosphate/sulfate permease